MTRKFTPKLIVRSNPFARVDNQVANVYNGICEWTVPLRIYSTDGTAEDLAAKIAALNAELTCQSSSSTPGVNDAQPTNTLTDKLARALSETPATVYTALKSDPILADRDELTEKRLVWEGSVVIRTEPFGYASDPVAITIDPDTVERVALFPLGAVSALTGDAPAALVLEVAGAGLSSVVAAIAGSSSALADFDLTISGSGGVGQIASQTITKAGRFRVLATLVASVASTRVGIGQDGATAPYSSCAIAEGEAALYDLGEFSSSGGTLLQVLVAAGNATLSHLTLVPVDQSLVSAWAMDSATSVTFAYDANSQPAATIGNGLVAPVGTPKLLVCVDPPDVEATVTVSYRPVLWGWSS